jgi:hypothetical protein
VSCGGLYFALQVYYEYEKLEREFERRLRRVLRKYGYSTKMGGYRGEIK